MEDKTTKKKRGHHRKMDHSVGNPSSQGTKAEMTLANPSSHMGLAKKQNGSETHMLLGFGDWGLPPVSGEHIKGRPRRTLSGQACSWFCPPALCSFSSLRKHYQTGVHWCYRWKEAAFLALERPELPGLCACYLPTCCLPSVVRVYPHTTTPIWATSWWHRPQCYQKGGEKAEVALG